MNLKVNKEKMNGDYPLVSIITPSLNNVDYLGETIDSVMSQDYSNVEHVIIDGGSTDSTVGLLERYQQRYPDKIRWILEPDRGISDALNKGLKLAKGEIFGWLGCGDAYYPGAISTIIEFFKINTNAYFVFGDCNIIEESGEIWKVPVEDAEWQQCFKVRYRVNPHSAFFRGEVVQSIGLFDTRLKRAHDHDYFLRAGKIFNIYYIEKTLSIHRRIKGHLSYAPSGLSHRELFLLSRRHGGGAFSYLACRYYRYLLTSLIRPVSPLLRPVYHLIKHNRR